MVGANACRAIGVKVAPCHQRGMAVNMAALEGGEFGQNLRVPRQNTGKIHEFGKADHLRVAAEGQQVVNLQPCAGGFEFGGGHTA